MSDEHLPTLIERMQLDVERLTIALRVSGYSPFTLAVYLRDHLQFGVGGWTNHLESHHTMMRSGQDGPACLTELEHWREHGRNWNQILAQFSHQLVATVFPDQKTKANER